MRGAARGRRALPPSCGGGSRGCRAGERCRHLVVGAPGRAGGRCRHLVVAAPPAALSPLSSPSSIARKPSPPPPLRAGSGPRVLGAEAAPWSTWWGRRPTARATCKRGGHGRAPGPAFYIWGVNKTNTCMYLVFALGFSVWLTYFLLMLKPVLPLRRAHPAQPGQHVRGLPASTRGHHRGHPQAAHPQLLQAVRKVGTCTPTSGGSTPQGQSKPAGERWSPCFGGCHPLWCVSIKCGTAWRGSAGHLHRFGDGIGDAGLAFFSRLIK